MVPDLDHAPGEPERGHVRVTAHPARNGRAAELDVVGRELQLKRIPDGGRRRPARRDQPAFDGVPPEAGHFGLHKVGDLVAAIGALAVEGGHDDVHALARQALQIDVALIKRQRQVVLVGSDPDVDPVTGALAERRSIELDRGCAAREVDHLRRGQVDQSITAGVDSGHEVVFALEHRVLVGAVEVVRSGRSGAVRSVLGVHAFHLEPGAGIPAVHLHVPIGQDGAGGRRRPARRTIESVGARRRRCGKDAEEGDTDSEPRKGKYDKPRRPVAFCDQGLLPGPERFRGDP